MFEIGSEFCLETDQTESFTENNIDNIFSCFEKQYLLSGRSAIHHVLTDIKEPIKKAYLPSYCCDSMLEPFLGFGIKVSYYTVAISQQGLVYEIDDKRDIDLFFAVSYFGVSDSTMDNIIITMKKRGIIVIEDVTHRLLAKSYYCRHSDYLIASLRKWFPIPTGGLAVKLRGKFSQVCENLPPRAMIENKLIAMSQKEKYIYSIARDESDELLKNEFLARFSNFEKELEKNFRNYVIDIISMKIIRSIDIYNVRKKRIRNSVMLYDGDFLSADKARFLFPGINTEHDCPLFVPILVEKQLRDRLKSFLIDQKIYCPVHWSVPANAELTDVQKNLYEIELSLICDQRYDSNHMFYMMNKLKEFFVKA